MQNVVKDLHALTNTLKTQRIDENIIRSLKLIRQELQNIKMYMGVSQPTAIFDRSIKSDTEYKFYKQIAETKYRGLPEIQGLNPQYVYLPFYYELETPTKSQILDVLIGMKTLAELGYVHRAIHPKHIMLTESNTAVIIDFGKMAILGQKSNLYSYRTSFCSRNTMLQNKSEKLDDIESLLYCLLCWFGNITFVTYSQKVEFYKTKIQYTGRFKDIVVPFIGLVKSGCEDHNCYINLFKNET